MKYQCLPQDRAVLVSGLISRPERYAMHKLIVAERRRDGPDSLKSIRDRGRSDFLIAALESYTRTNFVWHTTKPWTADSAGAT